MIIHLFDVLLLVNSPLLDLETFQSAVANCANKNAAKRFVFFKDLFAMNYHFLYVHCVFFFGSVLDVRYGCFSIFSSVA